MDGSLQGCRREGCVQQVKGEERAHTRTLGTGGEGSPWSTDTEELNSHLVRCYKMGGVAVEGGGTRRSSEEGEFGFSFFVVFTVFLLT